LIKKLVGSAAVAFAAVTLLAMWIALIRAGESAAVNTMLHMDYNAKGLEASTLKGGA
jgi:hypothetical protein